MLPKPEKIKNLKTSPEQLDLTDTLTKEKKAKHQRLYILVFLILTIGLSFSFWAYHYCHSFFSQDNPFKLNFHFPHLNLPQYNYQKDIYSILNDSANQFCIYVETVKTNKDNFIYRLNCDKPADFTQIISHLSSQPISSSSLSQTNLPPAAQIQEITNFNTGIYELDSLITIPQKQIIFLFKITGSNSDQLKNKIPPIIEKIYQQILNSD